MYSGWSEATKVKPWFLCAPKNIRTSEAITSVEVSWDPIDISATVPINYQIEIQSGENKTTKTYTTDKTSIIEEGLEPGSNYTARVRTVCDGETSEWSEDIFRSLKVNACPANHTLEPYDLEDAFMKHGIYRVLCNNCNMSFMRGGIQEMFYGCRACNYNLCPGCSKKPVIIKKKECPKGHILNSGTLAQRLGGTPNKCIKCNCCKKDFGVSSSPDLLISYCPTCNYYLCPECLDKPVVRKVFKCSCGSVLTPITLQERLSPRPFDTVMCNTCRKWINPARYQSDYPLLRCMNCRYDLCEECSNNLKE